MGDMMKNENIYLFIVFIISFIMFVVSTTLIGMEQEPSRGSSDFNYYEIIPDVVNIKVIVAVVSSITMVCSGVLLFRDIKEVKKRYDG